VPVTLGTVVGVDDEAERILAVLADERITLIVERVAGRSERHLNLMAGSARLSIYLSLPQAPATPLPLEAQAASERTSHLVLDLSTRALDAIATARSRDATIWTDLHDYDGTSAFHQPFLDAADQVFFSDDAVGDPRPLMSRLASEGKRLVVCTQGAHGALAVDAQGWHHVDAAPAEVVDTNGAGDAFLAGFLAATLRGANVPEAMRAGALQAATAPGTRHLSPSLDSQQG
jgi:sugar/nucleoside kinase (ribokinase family)